MKDFLKGTFGKLLQVVFNLLGVLFTIIGLFSIMQSGMTALVCFIIGVIFFAAAYGIKYWLGNIYRVRR